MVYKSIVIGSGPAGHTAAIYLARANLSPLMLEGLMAGGVAPGGQLTTTTEVENFPGFPTGISGVELMEKMRQQSINCGADIRTETVESVILDKSPFQVKTETHHYEAHTLVIATGATAKRLLIKGEDRYWQKGISACAVCDGALPIFRSKPLVVVGGGDSACEEAGYLTKFASKVYMLIRRDVMRASKVMQDRVQNNQKIELLWNVIPTEALGKEFLSKVKVKDVLSGEERDIEANGLFYAVGHTPNTVFLQGKIDLDSLGYIKTMPGTSKTSYPGVFACGDVQDHVYRQAITAAGTGCMAALDAERFLVESGLD